MNSNYHQHSTEDNSFTVDDLSCSLKFLKAKIYKHQQMILDSLQNILFLEQVFLSISVLFLHLQNVKSLIANQMSLCFILIPCNQKDLCFQCIHRCTECKKMQNSKISLISLLSSLNLSLETLDTKSSQIN